MEQAPQRPGLPEADAPTTEEQWRYLVERHPEGIVTITDWKVSYANPAALAIFGVASADEIVGRSVYDLAPPEERAVMEARIRMMERGEVPPLRVYRIRRPSGEVRCVEVHSVPLQRQEGRVVETVIRDVTERIRAEEELERNTSYIQLLGRVAVASNEAASADEALRVALEEVCVRTGWTLAHAYRFSADDEPALISAGLWYPADDERFAAFRAAHRTIRFEHGIGLPGRVWASRAPSWIMDTEKDTNFPRQQIVREAGLRAAFAFPALVGSEVTAVLEFFSEEPAEPDPRLLEVITHLGNQIGRVMERELAAEALRASEERYRTLAESAVDAIIVTDGTGIIVDWNQGAERIFGYRKEEVIARPATVITSQDLRTFLSTGDGEDEAHQQETSARTIERRGVRKNGEEFPVELSLSRWRLGGETFFAAIIRDITDRRRAAEVMRSRDAILEAAAYAAEAFLQAPSWPERVLDVLEHVGRAANVSRVYVFENDPDTGQGVRTSQRFEWVAEGITPQIDNPDLQHFPMEEAGYGRWAEILGRGGMIHAPVRDLPEGERPVLLEQGIEAIAVMPIFARGQWWGFMGFDDCVTARHWSMAELDALRVVTNALGAAIVRGWDDAALRQSRQALLRAVEELEERNAGLQEFAYVASHDLQEPLRKISAFATLLQEECATDVGESGNLYIERITDAAQRMSELIRALLELSRITTHGQHYEEIDLNGVIEGVLSDIEMRVHQTGGRVQINRLCRIEADPTQMRQLFQNLIGNALKFHRTGIPPLVAVSTTLLEAGDPLLGDGPACRIEVKDNGIGFDPQYAERIFQPFQRLHGRGQYGGTGIGLAICKRIVERHRGTITATSTPDEGSTFVITLPLRRPRGSDDASVPAVLHEDA